MTLRGIEDSWLERETGTLAKLRAAADSVEHHVVPVFHAPSEAELLPAGTGILARIGDRAYLISAAHVLDLCDSGVFLPTPSGSIEPLENAPVVTGRPERTTRKSDRVDIGFVRLTAQEAADMELGRMLDLDVVSAPPMPIVTTMFIALGFALSDYSSGGRSRVVSSRLTSFMTGIADERAHRLAGIDTRGQFLLRLDRRVIATHKSVGAPSSMRGMSGGGVWPVRLDVHEPSERVPCFAGLIVERPTKYRASLAVTRGTVIRYFVQRFDRNGAT